MFIIKKKTKLNFGFGLISQSSSIVLGNSPAVPFLLLRLRIRFSFTWLPTRKAHTTTTKFSSVVGCALVQKNSLKYFLTFKNMNYKLTWGKIYVVHHDQCYWGIKFWHDIMHSCKKNVLKRFSEKNFSKEFINFYLLELERNNSLWGCP